jgi:hypothetical protein
MRLEPLLKQRFWKQIPTLTIFKATTLARVRNALYSIGASSCVKQFTQAEHRLVWLSLLLDALRRRRIHPFCGPPALSGGIG